MENLTRPHSKLWYNKERRHVITSLEPTNTAGSGECNGGHDVTLPIILQEVRRHGIADIG